MVKQVLASIVTPSSEIEATSHDFSAFPMSLNRSAIGSTKEEEESKEERTEQLIVSIEHSRRITSSSQPANPSQASRSRRRRQRLNGGVARSRVLDEQDPVLQQQQESLPPTIETNAENGEEINKPSVIIEETAILEQNTATHLAASENMVGVVMDTAKEMTEAQQTPPQELVCSTSPVLPPDKQDDSASIPTASQSPPQSAKEEEATGVIEPPMIVSQESMEVTMPIVERGDGQEARPQEFVEEVTSEQMHSDPPTEEHHRSPPVDQPAQDEEAAAVHTEVEIEEKLVLQQTVHIPEALAGITTPPAEECKQETTITGKEHANPCASLMEIQQETVEEVSVQERPAVSPDLEQQCMEEREEEKIHEGLGIQEISAGGPVAEESQAMSIPEPTEQSHVAVEDKSVANDDGSAVHMEAIVTAVNASAESKADGNPTDPTGEVTETASRSSEGDDGEKVGGDGVRMSEEEEGEERLGQRVSADPAPIELDVVVHTVEEDDFSVFSAEASEAQNLDISTATTQPASLKTKALSSSSAINTEDSIDNDSRNKKRVSNLLSDKDHRESSTEVRSIGLAFQVCQ